MKCCFLSNHSIHVLDVFKYGQVTESRIFNVRFTVFDRRKNEKITPINSSRERDNIVARPINESDSYARSYDKVKIKSYDRSRYARYSSRTDDLEKFDGKRILVVTKSLGGLRWSSKTNSLWESINPRSTCEVNSFIYFFFLLYFFFLFFSYISGVRKNATDRSITITIGSRCDCKISGLCEKKPASINERTSGTL